jgi:hypothetical protein
MLFDHKLMSGNLWSKVHCLYYRDGVLVASLSCEGINTQFSLCNGLKPPRFLNLWCHGDRRRPSPRLMYDTESNTYMRQPPFRLLPISLTPNLILLLGPTIANASTAHSYQTFLSSVCLQILTSTSESSGR